MFNSQKNQDNSKRENRIYMCRPVHRMAFAFAFLSQIYSFSPQVLIRQSRRTTCCSMKLAFSSNSQDTNYTLVALENIKVIHLRRTVESTQDEIKNLLNVEHETTNQILAIIADAQSKGRGTSGRSWVASEGNLFMTCAIPMELVPITKVTLLPLGVGIQIAETITEFLPDSKPTLKWPNDVLLDGQKVAGTLIENHSIETKSFWLIGIGVNIATHPETLPKEDDDFKAMPRSATSLRMQSNDPREIPSAQDFGLTLATKLYNFTKTLEKEKSSSIITNFKEYANMPTSYTIRNTGEKVTVKDIQLDGQLKVVGKDGKERLLVADYFY